MTTWTCSKVLAALALTLLAACEEGQGGALFPASKPARAVALSQAKLASGSVALIPPPGFCIDKASLRQNFALMARCDALGVPSAAGNAPVGIILASVTTAAQNALPSPADTAAAHDLSAVSDVIEQDTSITFRANGQPPAPGLSDSHWRGTARMGDRIMAIALFGPDGGRVSGAEGREVINRLIAASRAGS